MRTDRHTDFSRGRSVGLVFPCLAKFSTVYCYPHSQRLWHSQESRNRCFSGTLLLFRWPVVVGNLISGSSAFSKISLNIWNFMVHVLLKPHSENFEYYLVAFEMSAIVQWWAFFDITFLWDWNENWPFPVLWPLLSFPDLLLHSVQHFNNIIF